VLAVLVTLGLARGVQHTLRLLLAGVIVGVVFGALAALVMFWAPEVMRAMQAFLLGTTAFLGWDGTGLLALVFAIVLPLAIAWSPALDALALGEATALSLGVPLRGVRVLLVVCHRAGHRRGRRAGGPHRLRRPGGAAPGARRGAPTHRGLLPLAALAGGLLLLSADVLSRWLLAPRELPVGVLTALLGGAYLLWLMHRRAP
jgi:iron complex transport system permease protein